MLNLEKIYKTISKKENRKEFTIQEDLDNNRFVLRSSKRLTYYLFKKLGNPLGRTNTFSNKSTRYYSEKELPYWWVARIMKDGGFGDIKLTNRKLNFMNYIDIDDIDVSYFSLYETEDFNIKKTFNSHFIDKKTGKKISYSATIYLKNKDDFEEGKL